jgi:hypothetical protein
MSRIDSGHWKISTGRHFQNGHHNTAKIQHCPVLWWPFWKWRPVEIFRCQESIRDFIIYPHMKWRWNWTMLSSAVAAILVGGMKCRTQFWKGNSKLSDFNDISYVGRLWCPELIPDIEKFLPVAIFKMAAKIQHSSISKVASVDCKLLLIAPFFF